MEWTSFIVMSPLILSKPGCARCIPTLQWRNHSSTNQDRQVIVISFYDKFLGMNFYKVLWIADPICGGLWSRGHCGSEGLPKGDFLPGQVEGQGGDRVDSGLWDLQPRPLDGAQVLCGKVGLTFFLMQKIFTENSLFPEFRGLLQQKAELSLTSSQDDLVTWYFMS